MRSLKSRIFLSLALLALITSGAGAADVFRNHTRGPGASSAFIDEDQSDPCISTFVNVTFSAFTVQSPPDPAEESLEAFVFISKYNLCTSTDLIFGGGFKQLTDQEFTIDPRNLSSASLNTTIEVLDLVSGVPFNVDVSMMWTANGDIIRSNQHHNFWTPSFLFKDRSNGTFRESTASGTISDGTTNFTPDPSLFAEISKINEGFTVITK